MKVWLAGATGLVGKAVLELLLADERFEQVTALVRRASLAPHPRLSERVVDFDRLEESLREQSVSRVFCCLGTTIAKAKTQAAFRQVDLDYPLALARAGLAAGAKSYLLVSSVGADRGSAMFYTRVKGELEDALSELEYEILHIVRPSLLLGDRAERRPGERLSIAVAGPLRALMVGPLRKYAPIAATDVAKALVNLSLRSDRGRFIHDTAAIGEFSR